jgi:lipopolysaccharide biosynthesis glycosyltransferase
MAVNNDDQNEIPVFFAIDNNFAPYLDCAIRSMEENASKDFHYVIYVMYDDLSEERKKMLESGVRDPFRIEFVPMEDKINASRYFRQNRLRCDYFTMTIFFRLFIAEMFEEYDKGIYIDSDIVVPGDISELYRTDLEGHIIGACVDHSIEKIGPLVDYIQGAVGVPAGEYINSGVLLMDLKKMRETGFLEHFLYLLNRYHFDNVAPDQDYINAMCNGDILYLGEEWDAMPPEGGSTRPTLEHPKLIHYNLFQKPWCYDDIPYEEYFWKYAKESPFYQEILDHKANYSAEQIESDRSCLNTLVTHGGELAHEEVTFRSVREKGEKVRIAEHQ